MCVGRPFWGFRFKDSADLRRSRRRTMLYAAECPPGMPGMSAGHLVAPVVAYKCVLQPVLCRFAPFRTEDAPSKQTHMGRFKPRIWVYILYDVFFKPTILG